MPDLLSGTFEQALHEVESGTAHMRDPSLCHSVTADASNYSPLCTYHVKTP